MVAFLNGASHLNDDVNAPQDPQAQAKKLGYIGDAPYQDSDGNTQYISGDVTGSGGPSYDPAGQGEDLVHGWRQAGTSAYDQDVDRARRMGADSQGRTAVTLNQGQADQSRGLQMGALGLMGDAARGNAPSRAAALGQASTDATIRANAGAAAGARGPGAAVSAMNNAAGGAAQTMAKSNAALTDLRGQEMGRNMTEYAQGAQGVEGQDINAATANAQLEARQRALNEARQESFEHEGWNVRKTQQQAADDYKRQQDAASNDLNQKRLAERGIEDQKVSDDASFGLGALMHMAGSDERMKRNVHPMTMGSLAGLYRK